MTRDERANLRWLCSELGVKVRLDSGGRPRALTTEKARHIRDAIATFPTRVTAYKALARELKLSYSTIRRAATAA